MAFSACKSKKGEENSVSLIEHTNRYEESFYGDLAVKVAEDGCVLLKNENNALPLENKKVNVFGWASSDAGFVYNGSGSGTGQKTDIVSFLTALEVGGIEYNTSLAARYNDLGWYRMSADITNASDLMREAQNEEEYKKFYGVYEADQSFYTETLMKETKNFSDTAIVVLGRFIGEGNDYSKKQYNGTGEDDVSRKLLALSQNEEYMLNMVKKNFDKVIVLINSANPLEADFTNDEGIDAVLHIGYPGAQGTRGVVNVLKGAATPSGKLTDTWAYDLSTAASYATSGKEGISIYPDLPGDESIYSRGSKYSEYLEDIYVGYQWYETADKEGFWNSAYAKEKWSVAGYRDVVQYPFGFGLSYTNFEWELVDCSLADGSALEKNGQITLRVKVSNVGEYAGADVVQLYYSAPYTKGGIEKSAIRLGAFAKTGVLQPNEAEIVTLTLNVEDMRSYDCYDKNNNGFMGYELESGAYVLSLRSDCHTLKAMKEGANTFTYSVGGSGFCYETDSASGYTVENRLTTYTNQTSGASSTIDEPLVKNAHSVDGLENDGEKPVYLTRANFASTFPESKAENKNAGSLIEDTHYIGAPVNNATDVAPTFGSTATNWKITDMIGVAYDDVKWNELVSQLSIDDACDLIAGGGYGTIAINSIGLEKVHTVDGASGLQVLGATGYPAPVVLAQTWSREAAYQYGSSLGEEANIFRVGGFYGPSANVHRSPMGGRNYEYFTEDAFLSGILCAEEVDGVTSRGVQVYVKHMGLNEQDTGRNGAYKWATEQSVREIYLKPFETAAKDGSTTGFMISIDRLGGVRCSGSYALLTEILRNEWGFKGSCITDYYQGNGKTSSVDACHDMDECIRAGCDLMLSPTATKAWFDDTKSATALKSIHTAAKNILYSYVKTLEK